MDPELYDEVLRRRAAVWTDLAVWLRGRWQRAHRRERPVEVPITVDEVLADLAHGR
jgi:hypothetical protein